MFITTIQKPNIDVELKAKQLAKELSCKYVLRNNSSLSQLKRNVLDNEVIVVGENELKYVGNDNLEFFFHPNLAKIRITSLLKGSTDRLKEISEVQPGDSVLDCTMGLATDAIVFSFLVGETGNVISTESELIPYILGREGLNSYKSGIQELDSAMRRVYVVHTDHLDYMRSLPDKSIDIVYFDPMFRQPTDTIALTPLRGLANNFAIKIEAIKEAKRVAKKKDYSKGE